MPSNSNYGNSLDCRLPKSLKRPLCSPIGLLLCRAQVAPCPKKGDKAAHPAADGQSTRLNCLNRKPKTENRKKNLCTLRITATSGRASYAIHGLRRHASKSSLVIAMVITSSALPLKVQLSDSPAGNKPACVSIAHREDRWSIGILVGINCYFR